MKILRHPFSQLCCQVSWMQQVVLQCPWQCYVFPHCQSSCPSQTQGSPTPPTIHPRRHGTRMLQLWYKECLPTRIHSGQVRYGCCASVPSTLRCYSFLQRHELGYFEMATSYRRSFIPPLACICSHRRRATPSPTLDSTHDRQVGGNVEG